MARNDLLLPLDLYFTCFILQSVCHFLFIQAMNLNSSNSPSGIVDAYSSVDLSSTVVTVFSGSSNNLSTNTTTVSDVVVFHRSNWSYAEQPNLPIWVYNASAVYLMIIGCFGIVSNLSILLVFCAKTSVSIKYLII